MHLDEPDIDNLRRSRGKKWATRGADILPAWIADMDFPAAAPIRSRLQQMVAESDLGYPHDALGTRLAELLARRSRERYNWQVDPGRVEVIADVVQGIRICLEMFTAPGDGAAILTPVYPPFLTTTASMDRRADCCTLAPGREKHEIDWQAMRDTLRPDTRVLLLCNPHNPTGRVFDQSELDGLAELALRHDLTVVSDEIHADLVLDGRRHIPFAGLAPEIAARTVTLTSATKTFNIAGLRCAMMIFGSRALHDQYRGGPRQLRGAVGSLGMHATEVAWTECDAWLDALIQRLESNRDRIRDFLARYLPDVGFIPPEATYLAWLDARLLAPGDSLCQHILEQGKLALNDGREFGPGGDQCVRLNFATSEAILDEALRRLHNALATGPQSLKPEPDQP